MAKNSKQLKIEVVELVTLTPDPKNARGHSERNIKAIAASLKRFGQQKPIVVDDNGRIVAGNGTYQAAKELGWTTIAIVRTNLTGSNASAFAVADNRTAELAEWNREQLAETMTELQNDGEDLEALGFSRQQLESLLEEAESTSKGVLPTAYEVLAECRDEAEQQRVYDWLRKEGVKCRVCTL